MNKSTWINKTGGPLLAIAVILLLPLSLFSQTASAQDCNDYGGCEMIQLKVSGVIENVLGIPITDAMITGVTMGSNNVNAVEYYEHCGDRNHKSRIENDSISTSGSTNETGFYELLFIICADDKNDFGLDYEITIVAPGFQSQTIPSAFSDNTQDDEINVTLVAQKGRTIVTPSLEVIYKGAVDCGDYTGCDMAVLKARGTVTDDQQNPITDAQIVAVESNRDNVNVIQFYSGCGNGFHEQVAVTMSTADSNSFTGDPGFYEVIFAVCFDDSKGLGPKWDADFNLTASAPGFQDLVLPATFDEGDDREDVDFMLVPGILPTDTPTEMVGTPTPTETPTVEVPTETPTSTEGSQSPTALNPNADINEDGVIDAKDLLEVLDNWFRIIE